MGKNERSYTVNPGVVALVIDSSIPNPETNQQLISCRCLHREECLPPNCPQCPVAIHTETLVAAHLLSNHSRWYRLESPVVLGNSRLTRYSHPDGRRASLSHVAPEGDILLLIKPRNAEDITVISKKPRRNLI